MTEVMRIDLATLRNEHREAVAKRELEWSEFYSTNILKIVESLEKQFKELAKRGHVKGLVATINLDDITGKDYSLPNVVRFQTELLEDPHRYLNGYMGDHGYRVSRLGGNTSRTISVEVLMDHEEEGIRHLGHLGS